MGTGQVIRGADDGGLRWSSAREAGGRCTDFIVFR